MEQEILNTVDDVQTPVVAVSKEPLSSEMTDVTPRPQSAEENASFKRMRLENERLRAQNEAYENREIERKMASDLTAIQEMDPGVGSLEELGEDFARLIAAGIAAPIAFAAIKEVRRAAMPPAMGALEQGSKGEKDFYLPEEVDALTPGQLADPGIWERVRASMTKW